MSQPNIPTATATAIAGKREDILEQQKRRQRRERLLRRAVSCLLTVPWFLGVFWTVLHPLVSVMTGQLKCRGDYIDENGLDTHRHRVENYPLERQAIVYTASTTAHEGSYKGMCAAVRSGRLQISPSVECLRHEATDTIAFDVARIIPAVGPIIDSTEAVVLVVGSENERQLPQVDKDNHNRKYEARHGDWYERSDLYASVLHLMKRLGSASDCPWLAKTIFVVSPSAPPITNESSGIGNVRSASASYKSTNESAPLGSVVEAFISSYLGNPHHSGVRPLPPEFTFPMIRAVLVLNDTMMKTKTPSSTNNNSQQSITDTSEVQILPQGTEGTLPNLDLVFATFSAFKSYPKGNSYRREHSVYHSNSEFRTHTFGRHLEERLGRALVRATIAMGWKVSPLAVKQYGKDLAGLFSFVASLVIES